MEVVTTMDTLTPRPEASSTADPDTLVQLLDPEGRRLDHSRYDAWVADLGPAELRGLYRDMEDRKSTRLNSSHVAISYAVFCLKKKKINNKLQHHSKATSMTS